jgi:hypothetical protein
MCTIIVIYADFVAGRAVEVGKDSINAVCAIRSRCEAGKRMGNEVGDCDLCFLRHAGGCKSYRVETRGAKGAEG